MFSLVFEIDFAIGRLLAGEPALMHQVMMVPAKEYQVIQARFSAIGPVFYMVSIDKSRVCTARK
jgi:hypothetical protein